jgi:hypothetical protein
MVSPCLVIKGHILGIKNRALWQKLTIWGQTKFKLETNLAADVSYEQAR